MYDRGKDAHADRRRVRDRQRPRLGAARARSRRRPLRHADRRRRGLPRLGLAASEGDSARVSPGACRDAVPRRIDGAQVRAACRFAAATGKRAAIGAMADLSRIVAGDAGTTVSATETGIPVWELTRRRAQASGSPHAPRSSSATWWDRGSTCRRRPSPRTASSGYSLGSSWGLAPSASASRSRASPRCTPPPAVPTRSRGSAYGDFAGFLVAWGYWISIWASLPVIAVAFTGSLPKLLPALQGNRPIAIAITLGAIWLVTLANLRGVKDGRRVRGAHDLRQARAVCGDCDHRPVFHPSRVHR